MAETAAATNEQHGHGEHGHGEHGHGHGEHGHGHGEHGHGDAKSHERHYVKIWGVLTVLLVVSVAGVELQDVAGIEQGTLLRLGITLFMAFGIAVWKAYLVVKHFMHLTVEPKYVGYLCATALAFMSLFFFFVAPDVMKHDGTNWENVSAKAQTGAPSLFARAPSEEPAAAQPEEAPEQPPAQPEPQATPVAQAEEPGAGEPSAGAGGAEEPDTGGDEAPAAQAAAAADAPDAGQAVAEAAPTGPMTAEGIPESEAERRADFIRDRMLSTL